MHAGAYSYGGGYTGSVGTFSGKAYNCIAGEASFGTGILTGILIYCRIENTNTAPTQLAFNVVSGAGKTRYCIDGNNTENSQG